MGAQLIIILFNFYLTTPTGGTVDATTVRINDDDSMEQVVRSNGGPWGGTMINERFFNMLRDLIGNDVMDEFKALYPNEEFEMRMDFEQEKQKV